MCVSLLLPDGRRISSIGELRKWIYPAKVPICYGYDFPPSADNCLCPVDWDAMSRITGERFVPTNDLMDMTIDGGGK